MKDLRNSAKISKSVVLTSKSMNVNSLKQTMEGAVATEPHDIRKETHPGQGTHHLGASISRRPSRPSPCPGYPRVCSWTGLPMATTIGVVIRRGTKGRGSLCMRPSRRCPGKPNTVRVVHCETCFLTYRLKVTLVLHLKESLCFGSTNYKKASIKPFEKKQIFSFSRWLKSRARGTKAPSSFREFHTPRIRCAHDRTVATNSS